MKKWYILICIINYFNFSTYAQNNTQLQDTILEESFMVSARASAMGEALGSLSSAKEASYYNPALINCTHTTYNQSKQNNSQSICSFDFIYVGIKVNKNSYDIIKDMKAFNAFNDSTIAQTVLNAHDGKKQFARISLSPNVIIKNLMLAPVIDQQIAAVSLTESNTQIRLNYQQKTGIILGRSFLNIDNKLFGGISIYYAALKMLKGDYDYSTIDNYIEFLSVLNKSGKLYNGLATNLGLTWKVSERPSSFFSLIVKNFNNTTYKTTGESYTIKQDITLSYATKINFDNMSTLNLGFDINKLEDTELSIDRKIKTGIELLYTINKRIRGSLNAGYNYSGLSYGCTLNIGMLGLQYANYWQNIGYKNEKIFERRFSYLLYINLIE